MKLHFGSGFFTRSLRVVGQSLAGSPSPPPSPSQSMILKVYLGPTWSSTVRAGVISRILQDLLQRSSWSLVCRHVGDQRARGRQREGGERREGGGRARKGVSPPCARLPLFHVPSNRQVRTGNVSLLSLSLSAPHEVSFTQGLSIRSSHTSPSHPLLRWRWLTFVRTEFGARSETVTNPSSSSSSSRDPARTPVSLCRSLSVKTGRRVRWNPTRGSEILKPAFPHNWMFGCCATEKKKTKKKFLHHKTFWCAPETSLIVNRTKQTSVTVRFWFMIQWKPRSQTRGLIIPVWTGCGLKSALTGS